MLRNTFFLAPRPPFRLDLTVWTLRRRPDNAVDRWDGQAYRRVLVLAGEAVQVSVQQVAPPDAPKLKIVVEGQQLPSQTKAAVSSELQRLLGLNLDLAKFYRFTARQKPLRSLAMRFRGMKPPRFGSIFECVINAIACQQLTLTVGIQLLNRLTKACGTEFQTGQTIAHAFPRPEDLVRMSPVTLRELGFSRQKGRAMLELAGAVAEGSLDLESVAALPNEAAIARLQALRGVGRWTAEYVLLRGMGRVNVFPGDDVGARNNLRAWLHLPQPLDYEGVGLALNKWRRYGGLIYFHLLLDRLAEAGCVEAPAEVDIWRRRVPRSTDSRSEKGIEEAAGRCTG
jgi:DNA-3-methyladenine glycosylase II